MAGQGSEETVKEQPEHLGKGLLNGFRGFGRGLSTGLQDLASKPLEGAKEGGARGFARGLGQGAWNFGAKTASGTVDFANNVAAGAKSTPDAIGRAVNNLRQAPEGDSAKSMSTTGMPSSNVEAPSSGMPSSSNVDAPSSGSSQDINSQKQDVPPCTTTPDAPPEPSSMEQNSEPAHLGTGLLTGFKSFGQGLGSGLVDLASKPLEGAREGGVQGFVKGVGQGAVGFGNKTAEGTKGMAQNIASGAKNTSTTIGNTVNDMRRASGAADGKNAPQTEDELQDEQAQKDEKAQQDEQAQQNEPAHLGQGIVQGARGLGRGITTGLIDLATKPVEGAREAGARGFVQGLGQGAMDFGAKTVCGTQDFGRNVASGAKNTTDAIGRAVNDFRQSKTEPSPGGATGAAASTDTQEGTTSEVEQKSDTCTEALSEAQRDAPAHIGAGLAQGVVGLGKGLSSGIVDLATKPIEGARETGAQGFFQGLGEGARSFGVKTGSSTVELGKNLIAGAKNTPDAIGQTMKNISSASPASSEPVEPGVKTDDSEQPEPPHIGMGIVSGVRGLGRDLSSGIQDLASKPVEGARENGFAGFAKGIGQGAVGFGSKAALGTKDLATNLVSGAKNTPDALSRAMDDLRKGGAGSGGYPSETSGTWLFPGRASQNSAGRQPPEEEVMELCSSDPIPSTQQPSERALPPS